MRRIGPPEPEELGQHRSFGLQAAPLVIRMRAALLAEEEARARNGGDRAGIERLAHTLSVDDPPGRQDRNLNRRPNTFDQPEHRRRAADVPAGLDPLGYHRIGSRRRRGSRLLDGATLVGPRTPPEPAWLPPEGDDHVGGRRRLHIPPPEKRQHEVDRDWPAGEPPGEGKFLGDRRAGSPDRPQASSLRYGGGKLMTGYGPHPGLNDRRWQAAQVEHRGHPTAKPAALRPHPVSGHAGMLHPNGLRLSTVPLRGRAAVFEFWRDVLARYENAIENLSLDEEAPGSFVPKARLRHRPHEGGEELTYAIVQTTELRRGRVVRQVNVLDAGESQARRVAAVSEAGGPGTIGGARADLVDARQVAAELSVDRRPLAVGDRDRGAWSPRSSRPILKRFAFAPIKRSTAFAGLS